MEAVTASATKQPVHRKMVPSLITEPAILTTVDSAFGHLARSTTGTHFSGPPPFSVIVLKYASILELSTTKTDKNVLDDLDPGSAFHE